MVVAFVNNKYLSLEEFNRRIVSFEYSNCDRQNRPQPVKIKPLNNLKVKQTACEMWNLLRLLPYIIGDLIPLNHHVWVIH